MLVHVSFTNRIVLPEVFKLTLATAPKGVCAILLESVALDVALVVFENGLREVKQICAEVDDDLAGCFLAVGELSFTHSVGARVH